MIETGPGKHRQAEIDRRRIQRIHCAIQIVAKGFADVHGPRRGDQDLRKVGIDAPIVFLVCVGQRRSGHTPPEAHVVQLWLHGPEARLDIAKTLPIGQLGEAQTKQLIPAGKPAISRISVITPDAFLKFVDRHMRHYLREDGPAMVHAPL